MFSLNLRSRTAIYEQIIEQIEGFVVSGVLKENDSLPSVRSLAVELAINPNTAARAYGELERRGIVNTVVGRGTVIASNAADVILKRMTEKEFKETVTKYFHAGVEREVLVNIIDKVYEEAEK